MTTNPAQPLDKLGEEFCALCWDEKIEEVKKFLEKNKDLAINELFNSRGVIPLRFIRYFLPFFRPILRLSFSGQTALYCAASKGNIDLIHLLLQIDGIDINMRKGKSSTPLHGTLRFRGFSFHRT
jgi:ankyrin repeat protein